MIAESNSIFVPLSHTLEQRKELLQNRKAAELHLSLEKISDLYHDKLFTVVPKDMGIDQGILPEDQKFSSKYVLLWDSWRDLISFQADQWKKVSVQLPKNAKFTILNRVPGNGYALSHVPNTWPIEEQSTPPQFVE